MIAQLLQIRAHLILCFRADEKVDMVKDDQGKTKIVPKKTLTSIDGYVPICDKSIPYELTASFLLLPNAPGVGRPIKLQEQHKIIFPEGKQIDEEAGRRVAAWAAGGEAKPAVASTGDAPHAGLSESERLSIIDGMEACSTLEELAKSFTAADARAKAVKDVAAREAFVKVKDRRKAILSAKELIE
jgi:hypothetical protein